MKDSISSQLLLSLLSSDLLLDKFLKRFLLPHSSIALIRFDHTWLERQYNRELLVCKPLDLILHGVKGGKHDRIIRNHGLSNRLKNGFKITAIIIEFGVEEDKDVFG